MMDRSAQDEMSFASKSVPRHLTRGAIGFGLLAGSLALLPVVGMVSLLLLPAGIVALRGCPACWTIGLIQTISRGRLQKTCVDGTCQLTSRPQPLEEPAAAARQ